MMYKKHFKKFVNQFISALDKKMEQGYHDYGDESFSRDPKELIEELELEVLDLAGWGLVLYVKLQSMKDALKNDKKKTK